MKIRWNKGIVALTVILSVTSMIGVIAHSRSFQQKNTFYEPAVVTEAPLVVSKVQGLQINEVRLINQGTNSAAIEIDVTNKRDVALMSIDFIARNKTGDSGGIAIDGLEEADNPRRIMPPHSLRTFTVHLGEIIGEPFFLAAAVFEDGKEEGDKRSLDSLRQRRVHHQLKTKAETRNGGQQ